MTFPALPWTRAILALQTAAIGLILVALPFYPPAQGRILIIPIGAQSSATLLPRLLASGARLVDRGPIAGSYIVDGTHPALHDVIIIAAPQAGCGTVGKPA